MSAQKRLLAAVCKVVAVHDGQKRQQSGKPFVLHPLHTAGLLVEVPLPPDVSRDDCMLAALLHHLLEQAAYTREQMEKDFGTAVTGIVAELTHDSSLPVPERRKKMLEGCGTLSPAAKVVRLADRLDNMRDLKSMSPAYLKQYCEETRVMLERMRGACPPLEAKIQRLYAYYTTNT